ncbi:MAG TPA: exodeoxyribonuclease VII large subunit [Lachnospiraceae bacterium]|nr:exodeoxyribonuclease VII large subunit [Lachnospiraceae bacterium]
MQNVYTVKQVNAYIKNMFTQDFMLSRIYVKGEVSNVKYHTSGHVYFSLKDASGVIACILFAGNRGGLGFRMQDGQQVIVFGSVTTYERDGRYQLYAKEIRLDGLGLLYERFQALKEELGEMGMFDEGYKQPVPRFAKTVGIVTAPTGAAIMDIMNISRRRNPYVQLILYPAQVQGEGAKESIVRGIHALEKEEVDVIIVGRGGGSIEDLWAFNEEVVARAIFDCRIPVISAVGHETDTTIADYVADLRAPTPSAAAELAVWEYQTAALSLQDSRMRLLQRMYAAVEKERMRLDRYVLQLKLFHPQTTLQTQKQYLAETEEQLRRFMKERILSARHRMALAAETMKGLSPLEKLSRGYAYVEDKRGTAVISIDQVESREPLTIYVADGVIQAEVLEKKEEYHG